MNPLILMELARHLPPSASALRLAALDQGAGRQIAALRPDIDLIPVNGADALRALSNSSADAVLVTGTLEQDVLTAALYALREGGRLIAFEANGEAEGGRVSALEAAGYTRILVEALVDEQEASAGVLMRGEKPYAQTDTLARIGVVAKQETPRSDLAAFKGRYVHVLVRQTPNKPAWALRADERVEWHVVALAGESGAALAFGSLSAAVAFMQRAVLEGAIQGVNKVGKFPREAAGAWTFPLVINPLFEDVKGHGFVIAHAVDPHMAVTGEE